MRFRPQKRFCANLSPARGGRFFFPGFRDARAGMARGGTSGRASVAAALVDRREARELHDALVALRPALAVLGVLRRLLGRRRGVRVVADGLRPHVVRRQRRRRHHAVPAAGAPRVHVLAGRVRFTCRFIFVVGARKFLWWLRRRCARRGGVARVLRASTASRGGPAEKAALVHQMIYLSLNSRRAARPGGSRPGGVIVKGFRSATH